MSLLGTSKSGNSSDSIKITENPDSAVITPIPSNDDRQANFDNTRKIIRPTEKRPKKQSFASLLEPNEVEVSRYTLDSLNSEYEKEKKIDKESDDDITLIKVVKNEEKKKKRFVLPDDINFEVVKESSNKEIEVVEKLNGDKSRRDSKDSHQNDSNFDAEKALDWQDGVGSLPGSTVKVCEHFYKN